MEYTFVSFIRIKAKFALMDKLGLAWDWSREILCEIAQRQNVCVKIVIELREKIT